jgi:hypothetical protein
MALAATTTASDAQDARLVTTVVDGMDRPLQGVRLEVALEESGSLVALATTDGHGTVTILVKPARRYVIRAALKGYEPLGASGAYPPPGDVSLSFRLVPREPVHATVGSARQIAPGVVEGRILSFDGEPLGGVYVQAETETYQQHLTSTAVDGSFRLSIPPGTYRLSSPGVSSAPPQFRSAQSFVAFAPGEYSTRLAVTAGRVTRGIDIRLKPVHHFNATVTVRKSAGDATPNAEVQFSFRRESPHVEARGVLRTDSDGMVQLGAARGSYFGRNRERPSTCERGTATGCSAHWAC